MSEQVRLAEPSTLMLRAGINPRVVSERLGRATVSIALDAYSRVLPTLQEKATGDLNAWLAGQG